MNSKADSQRMEKIVSLCKRRGFIFQSSEIYGGLNGAWDYGPLGVELKRNLKNYWWRVIVHERDDVVGMDGSILDEPRRLEGERPRRHVQRSNGRLSILQGAFSGGSTNREKGCIAMPELRRQRSNPTASVQLDVQDLRGRN